MKKILLLFIFSIISQSISAQLIDNLTIGLESNITWYNDDSYTGPFYDDVNQTGDDHLRFNNYLKLDYTFLKNFTASVQLESYEPFALLNYSPNFEGTDLGTYSLNYRTKKLDITAGHFYSQFGSGLILRNWEDRQLGINNALLGGKVKFDPSNSISLTALYGKQRFGFDTSEGEIFGANAEIDLSNALKLESSTVSVGISYVGRKNDISTADPNYDELTNAFSGRIDYSGNNFYAGAEYVTKSEDIIIQSGQAINDFIKPGNAILLNTGFAKSGFGLDITLRRLENMSFYSDRDKSGNVFNENILNYTPALTKQHDYLLTNIYVYQAQPAVLFQDPTFTEVGEIGGQFDLFYKIKKGTKLGGKYGTKIAINGSYWAGLDGDYDFNNFDYDTDLIGFGEKYYSDLSLEVRKKWNSKWTSIFYYVNQYYNKRHIEDSSNEIIKTNIFVGEATYKLGSGKSIRMEAQHLSTSQDRKNWAGGTFEFNLNSRFSFYVNDIYNYGNDDKDKRTHYYNFGGSYTKGAARFGINYGRQRGGLLCVGGVCRIVSEATGLTANISLSF